MDDKSIEANFDETNRRVNDLMGRIAALENTVRGLAERLEWLERRTGMGMPERFRLKTEGETA